MPELDCEVILSETEALAREVGRLGLGDVVVMFFDKLEPLLEVLARFGAVREEGARRARHARGAELRLALMADEQGRN